MIGTGRRRRNPTKLTPEQLRIRREKDKVEEYISILTKGLSSRLKHFYGSADDMLDLLDIVDLHLMDATRRLKAAEIHYEDLLNGSKNKASNKEPNQKRSKVRKWQLSMMQQQNKQKRSKN